jgi:hypothetical protein
MPQRSGFAPDLAAAIQGGRVVPEAWGREDPLPDPRGRRVGVLPRQGACGRESPTAGLAPGRLRRVGAGGGSRPNSSCPAPIRRGGAHDRSGGEPFTGGGEVDRGGAEPFWGRTEPTRRNRSSTAAERNRTAPARNHSVANRSCTAPDRNASAANRNGTAPKRFPPPR